MTESIFKEFKIPTVEELLSNKTFMKNFVGATERLHLKGNTLTILNVYANLAILEELKRIGEILSQDSKTTKGKLTRKE